MIVTLYPPVIAELLAAKVNVLVPVVVLGLKDALMPLGRPDAVKLTLALKLFAGVIVMVLAPLDPCVRLTLLGDAERVKFGAAFMVRLIAVVLFRLPDVPVIVTAAVPAAAVLLAENVSVLLVKVLFGLKEAVTPLGTPDRDKLTFPEKEPIGVTEIVLLPLAPCRTVMLLGEADNANPIIGVAPGQLLIKFRALMLPIPVAKSQPVVVPYAGVKELLEVESTPVLPEAK